MEYRSTNVKGYVHFGGDIVSGVEDGRGLQLGSASTSSIPALTPVGDDTAVNLAILPKGSGAVYLGSTTAASTGITLGGIKGVFYANSTYSHGAIAVDRAAEFSIASTRADVVPGDLVSVAFRVDTADLSSAISLSGFRLSTAAASRVTIILQNEHSTATSTGSGTFTVSWIDLT